MLNFLSKFSALTLGCGAVWKGRYENLYDTTAGIASKRARSPLSQNTRSPVFAVSGCRGPMSLLGASRRRGQMQEARNSGKKRRMMVWDNILYPQLYAGKKRLLNPNRLYAKKKYS